MAKRLSRRNLAGYIADFLMAEEDHAKVIKQLAAYLIESRRTKELDLIVRDVQYLLSERGIVVGSVVSAFDLSAATKSAIEKFVKDKTGASKILLDEQIDPSVLGGVKINLPGRQLDQTIAHQLTVLKTRFKKA